MRLIRRKSVNARSKHDNQTLWDMISYKAAQEADLDTRVRMQAVSLATVMLGQGIAFDQQGSSCCAQTLPRFV